MGRGPKKSSARTGGWVHFWGWVRPKGSTIVPSRNLIFAKIFCTQALQRPLEGWALPAPVSTPNSEASQQAPAPTPRQLENARKRALTKARLEELKMWQQWGKSKGDYNHKGKGKSMGAYYPKGKGKSMDNYYTKGQGKSMGNPKGQGEIRSLNNLQGTWGGRGVRGVRGRSRSPTPPPPRRPRPSTPIPPTRGRNKVLLVFSVRTKGRIRSLVWFP